MLLTKTRGGLTTKDPERGPCVHDVNETDRPILTRPCVAPFKESRRHQLERPV